MICPECNSFNTRSEGEEEGGVEYFECLDCGRQFDETEVDPAVLNTQEGSGGS